MPDHMEIVDPLEIDNWNELIRDLPGSSFFHTRQWAEVLHNTYKYLPFYFVSRNKNSLNSVIPLMEINSIITGKRGVSLPFTDTCAIAGRLASASRLPESITALAKERKWKYMEFRADLPLDTSPAPSSSFYEHIVNLESDSDRMFKSFRSSTRRNIKRAEQELTTDIHNTSESLEAYYHLHCLTRKRQGVPPQPFRFFENIFKYIISNQNGNIFITRHGLTSEN